MSQPALFPKPKMPRAPAVPIPKRTEREMFTMLHTRYNVQSQGTGERYVCAEQVRAHAGFADGRMRTMDFFALDLWQSSGLAFHGHEVKVARSDWLHELKSPEKADVFRPYVTYWWLVTSDRRIAHESEIPDWWGWIYAVGGRLRVGKPAPRLTPQPMPLTMQAALMRSIARTATRGLR
jgi:hypothetical protein